jgi:energy-coupling factor transporter transmembrane protein EcfT
MADVTAFSYLTGASALHKMDVRFKLASMILCSLATVKAQFAELFFLTLALGIILLYIRFPLKTLIRELRYFSVLLLFVFIARSLSAPGLPFIKLSFVTVTYEGINDGTLVCWRLLNIVFTGIIFVATTRPSTLKTAVEWWLKPLPFIPEQRVAVMMSLMIRFMPVILEQARETADAQKARGVENRKNPLYRLKKIALPVLIRTFITADELAVAMDARCYTEKRTSMTLTADRNDWLILGGVILFCYLMVV